MAGLVGVLGVSAVQAQMQVTLYQDLSNYSFSDGGEFRAVPDANLLNFANPTLAGYVPATADSTTVNPYFQTFCVEKSEYFTPGNAYNVSLSYNIKYDAGLFLPNGEPLTMGTAWLYSQFAAGSLIGSGPFPYAYAYGGSRTATAGDLQEAIWYLQVKPLWSMAGPMEPPFTMRLSPPWARPLMIPPMELMAWWS